MSLRNERGTKRLKKIEKIGKLEALESGHALIVKTETREERRIWHRWAAENNFTHHVAIKSTHFDAVEVCYCSECESHYYFDKLEDSGDGFLFCPNYYRDDECGAIFYRDDSDSEITCIEVANALYITNGALPEFPPDVLQKRGQRIRKPQTRTLSELLCVKDVRYVIVPINEY